MAWVSPQVMDVLPGDLEVPLDVVLPLPLPLSPLPLSLSCQRGAGHLLGWWGGVGHFWQEPR